MEADIRWLDDPKVFRSVSCQPTVIIPFMGMWRKQQKVKALWCSLWTETGSSPIR